MKESIGDRLTETVLTGGAVCLLGAGYSIEATDQGGRPVPNTTELIKEIKSAVGISDAEYASLSDIAEYCEEVPERQQLLRKIMLGRLTLCNPSENQKTVTRLPWRSIFTTNFDDLVERSIDANSYQVITPTIEPATHVIGKVPVYYIHGRALDLLETDTDPRFVISERNYLQLHDDNRSLYARLKNELFCANLIVIAGYSLRDLEVASMLIDGGQPFRNKTIIICGAHETPMALSRLKKFGEVLPIGIDGLAAHFSGATVDAAKAKENSFQFIDALEPVNPAEVIEGDDFIRLILTGSFSREKYQTQMQQSPSSPEMYCIRRGEALDAVLQRSPAGVCRYVISSDLGNGKSLFLDQLSEELLVSGVRVFRISSNLSEVFEEIELALSTRQPMAFLIDDVIRHRDAAKFVGARLNALSILVCAVRGDPGELAFRELEQSLGGASRVIDLNRLSAEEVKTWDAVLERWGLWEERRGDTSDQRLAFLTQQCASENRSIVLSLFRSSRIATKIDQIVSFFVNHGHHQRTFAALLISSLCQQHVSWESLVSWLGLDEGRLRKDLSESEVSALFVNGRDWNAFTSAQLAEYILRTKYVEFDRDTLVDVFSTIVLSTADSASDSYLGSNFRENLKELMKFRFLTRLFGEGESAVKLISAVYSRLSKARLIRNNPQFWLQYAMSRMEILDFSNAETYLNTALGLANERGASYSPFQILDQRARLFFMKNTKSGVAFRRSEILTAIKDLVGLLDKSGGEIIYLYRSVPLIGDFVEVHIDDLSEEVRSDIKALLNGINLKGQSYTRLPRSKKGETRVLQKALSDTLLTLNYG
ncbi:SIR2 family protein [Brevundimonas sp.]|uniref:SIR2 family protein n=1 Tax=Brevundimonas sp. TaxID=1871086 RepID=UPI00248949E9|nr:SIR2 family protein [Brevundimonas sp.]MDI1281393.1 SIR2 family protein [Brevundimonas sp.]